MLGFRIAIRFLRKSPVQSILIAAGIAVGIGVQVFLGSLITSLQASLVDQTIGNSPQVVVTAGQDGAAVAYTPQLQQALEAQVEITTVVPTRAFSAIYSSGRENAPLQVTGGALDELDTIYDITGRLVAGEASLDSDEVIVGKDFADKYGLRPTDQFPVTLPSGEQAGFVVSGVFDFGSAAANSATAFVNGDRAAEVLGLAADEFSAVDAQVDDVFSSEKVATDLRGQPALEGLTVTEWQAENADLLSALQSQSSSSYMIQFFVLVAVALGIASTLAISAVQKTRQIGILKAMGMKDRQSGRIFLWQALILGVSGAAVGVAAGLGLIALFTFLGRDSESLFPITPQVGFVVLSFVVGVLVAVVSSFIPSRRTSKLDPIEVIQGG
ncbi:MAG TPA: FtsX-like permease family protein [Thermoleophilia bacterium]|nr:FtsX-like permease family protein [Thermoleophilia bacterium]